MRRKIGISGVSLTLIVSLISCGGGGDGVPASAPSAQLDGTVTDAVITNGTLRVYEFDNGQQGSLLAETTTDGKGDFVFEKFTSPDRPIVIEVRDGRYTEEASGVSVELLDGQTLRAYMFYEQGSAITVQITPLTHLASCLADYKINHGINVNNAITEAASIFSGLAGIDILGTRPLDITDPNNANFEITDSLRYGTILAAISSFTAEVSAINGVTPHRFNQNSSIYATQVLCQDIASDGIFNGLGFINNGNSVGQLSLGSVALNADTFRNTIAQNILSIISSDRNNTGLGIDDFVLYANEIASSTDAIYGGVPATGVDQEGPVSTAVLSPDSFIKSIVNLSFNVTDPIGLKAVQFEVNGLLNSNAQIANPILSLNTTNYTDGNITITVVATDVLNNESRTDFNYVIDNTSPIIALTSSKLVNNKSYTASGTYEAQGAPVTSIMVNGVNAAINATLGTWTADINLLSGSNIVTVQIIDAVGNGNNVEVSVGVDLIFPTITSDPRQVRFTTFQGQLNLCNIGQLTPSSGNTNPVCISTDNVSLNGATISSDLQFDGYVLLGFTPTDPQGAGIFTSQENLIVEYKYELNSTEIVSWTTAPKSNGNLFYYFPMVTEYLGSNWFQTTTNDVHKVTFRVTDNAGNSTALFYEVRFDVLIPEIVISSALDTSSFTAVTFASRASLDGSLVSVDYGFENSSSSAYLISLADSNQHSVSHSYETGVRKNRSRVKAEEQWKAVPCSGGACSTSGTTQSVSNVTFTVKASQSGTVLPSPALYGAYQDVTSDSPSVGVITDVPVVTPFLTYSCTPAYANANSSTAVTLAYANGSIGFPVCAATANGKLAPYVVTSSLQSTIVNTVENEPGYPLNDVFSTSVPSVVFTNEIVVFNATLGTPIFPIDGWYRIPPLTSVQVSKKVLLPVLTHYTDIELLNLGTFASYTLKRLDLSTTWSLDTDLTFTRVIDPGDIALVGNVTPSISVAGNGIYQHTIAR